MATRRIEGGGCSSQLSTWIFDGFVPTWKYDKEGKIIPPAALPRLNRYEKKEFCSSGDSFTLSDNGHLECERAFWLWAKKMNPHPMRAISQPPSSSAAAAANRALQSCKPRKGRDTSTHRAHLASEDFAPKREYWNTSISLESRWSWDALHDPSSLQFAETTNGTFTLLYLWQSNVLQFSSK